MAGATFRKRFHPDYLIQVSDYNHRLAMLLGVFIASLYEGGGSSGRGKQNGCDEVCAVNCGGACCC